MGDLSLWFKTINGAFPLHAPPSHDKFKIIDQAEVLPTSAFSHQVVLTVEDTPISRQAEWETLICRNKIWELWKDHEGNFIFTNPCQELHRQISISPAFMHGVLRGDFSSARDANAYLLPQDLEIVFFVNWLAGFGDVILHASGFARDGKGVIFTGPSGVGKSTLAASLADEPTLTILGEDQVLLRLIDNRFWVFGTPWHIRPEMCSPVGVPLEKIFFLERNGIDEIRVLKPADGVTRLLQTAFIPYYRTDVLEKILERLVLVSERLPFYSLSYRPGLDVLDFISKG